jgi:hypothetical protein
MTAFPGRGTVAGAQRRTPEEHDMSPVEIRARLLELAQERIAAEEAGLTEDAAYMADLEAEVLEYRTALVGAMVTEIATFRGQLFGRDLG